MRVVQQLGSRLISILSAFLFRRGETESPCSGPGQGYADTGISEFLPVSHSCTGMRITMKGLQTVTDSESGNPMDSPPGSNQPDLARHVPAPSSPRSGQAPSLHPLACPAPSLKCLTEDREGMLLPGFVEPKSPPLHSPGPFHSRNPENPEPGSA